ncbi:MAG: UDP-N-acetylglucosamine 1-carboxyvinyltransferase [Verrucomicrobia bacterium]|nr:UDP-N-acetylglucosamine 1-carboxyvinyltransferase [Verrucomicrobiota bacterium]
MARFIIQGGRQISGPLRAHGNKNAVLPMLAACVLTDDPVVLSNIPLIEDVRTMLAVLADLGVDVSLRGHTVTLCAKGLNKTTLNPDLCRRVRSSILFAGPMAARHGRVTLSPPGGDFIGRRRLDTHFDGLQQLGITVSGDKQYDFRCKQRRSAALILDEASVTATENLVMAAVLGPGQTTIFNAACEPHVQDLCAMLNNMGARILGMGTNYLTIHGVPSLGGVRYRVAPDYIETVSFMAAAALTGGELTTTQADQQHFEIIGRPLKKLGLRWTAKGGTLRLPASQVLRIRNDFGAAVPKIEDGPWPNFPSDLMSVAIVLATQARGTVLFFEKMFESRMYFVDRLIEMGARIVQCDPHRVVVAGPSSLHGIHMLSPDIRAGMALLLAALTAKGESVIESAESIDRGYERVDEKLRKLGADIVRVK